MQTTQGLRRRTTRCPATRWLWLGAVCTLAAAGCATKPLPPLDTTPRPAVATPAPDRTPAPALVLGPGDPLTVTVFGQPELTTATLVADDGTATLPLAGAVPVEGLSAQKAADRIAAAFRDGGYLLDPQVTVTLAHSHGNQVSVLGAVRNPGRFVIERRTTLLDALAQAGGIAENGGDVVVLLRPDKNQKVLRYTIDLGGLNKARTPVPTMPLRGGDSLFVPPAEQFYILGEVNAPNMYRLEPGMTVIQAISRGGGVTPRGSSSRVEVKRRRPDGTYVTSTANLGDVLQANDVVRVKERIF